jgi:hypothetical protein
VVSQAHKKQTTRFRHRLYTPTNGLSLLFLFYESFPCCSPQSIHIVAYYEGLNTKRAGELEEDALMITMLMELYRILRKLQNL